jgi:hypothetical protein
MAEAVDGLVLVSDAAGADSYWMALLCHAGGVRVPRVEGLAEFIAPYDQATLSCAVEEGRRRYPVNHRAGRDARSLAEVLRHLAGLDEISLTAERHR